MKKNYDFSAGRRGAVLPAAANKVRITIRLDSETLNWFKAKVEANGGGNYQTLLNDALREHMTQEKEPLEKTLQRVIRKELHALKKKAQAPQKL